MPNGGHCQPPPQITSPTSPPPFSHVLRHALSHINAQNRRIQQPFHPACISSPSNLSDVCATTNDSRRTYNRLRHFAKVPRSFVAVCTQYSDKNGARPQTFTLGGRPGGPQEEKRLRCRYHGRFRRSLCPHGPLHYLCQSGATTMACVIPYLIFHMSCWLGLTPRDSSPVDICPVTSRVRFASRMDIR